MQIILANPRGFCAGVERAIAIVERAIEKFGAPIYVRHEVVHNKFVCDDLRKKGAVFIDVREDHERARGQAAGAPEEVLTAEAIQRIFGVAVSIRPGSSGRRHIEYLIEAELRKGG